jgi:hypothetical protein
MVCHTGETCPRELENRHYTGGGHGPVLPAELVALVVLQPDGTLGAELNESMISPRRLGRGQISLARASHASLHDIQEYVIKGRLCVGAAAVAAANIRSVIARWNQNNTQVLSRGACILPEVAEGDHDSHASLKACDAYEQLG